MRKLIYSSILLFSALIILSRCNNESNAETSTYPVLYEFTEPSSFPFEINDKSSNVEIYPDLHQFVYHYLNQATTQQINYILSKVPSEPEKYELTKETEVYKLENGLPVYYEEDSTSQSLWWEREDGFLARYVYFVNGNSSELGVYKLKVDDLVNLANQVQ